MKIELSDYFKQQGYRSAYLFVNNMGRRCVGLVHETFKSHRRPKKRFISYAKYLWISANEREVPNGLEVDHINNNPKDDRIENLQLLSKSDNIKKEFEDMGRLGKLVVDLVCPICGTKFTKRLAQVTKSAKKQQCSCSARCSAMLQAKHIPFDKEEYFLDVKKKAYKTVKEYRY